MTEILTEFEVEEEVYVPNDFEAWCINIYPIPCKCGELMCHYVDSEHHIVVWKEKDAETILTRAAILKELDLDPKIVSYAEMLGPCVLYEEARKYGTLRH